MMARRSTFSPHFAASLLAVLPLLFLPALADPAAKPQAAKPKPKPTTHSAFDEPQPIRDKWAIVIGVNSFHDQSIYPIQYANKNANELSTVLKDLTTGHFAPDHVLTLTDPKTTKFGIEDALGPTWLAKKALPHDFVLLYICTRTMPSPDGDDIILLCSDTEAKDAVETGLPLKNMLTDLRRRLQSPNILCVLDTSPTKDDAYNGEIPMNPSLEEISKESGVSILSANLPELPSYESTIAPRSFFLSFLKEGIKAASGQTPLITLSQYIKQGVSDLVDTQLGKKETPTLILTDRTTLGGTPIGLIVKSSLPPHNISFGHPVDQLAMTRPDLAARPTHKEEADDEEDDEESDAPKPVLDFKTYMGHMKQQIQAKWQPPKGFENRKIAVIFTIKRDGTILSPQVVESGGDAAADKAALDALTAASPLEPLPLGAPKSVQIRYQFVWRVSSSTN